MSNKKGNISIYGEFKSGATGGFVTDISQIRGAKEVLDDKVDKVQGKQLSTNDYTTADRDKLKGIEASAQINDIETIYVDNFPKEIKNKNVNLNIPSKYEGAIVSLTYAELKALRDNKELIPGTMYRLTDFTVNANEKGTLNCNMPNINGVETLGSKFSLLLTAKDDHTLYTSAQILSSDIADFDRDAWNVEYSLDNDTSIFPEESVFAYADYNTDAADSGSFRFPVYTFYYNSLYQFIILKDELLGTVPKTINKISYYVEEAPDTPTDFEHNTMRIYLKNTTMNTLDSYNTVSESDLCCVGTFKMSKEFKKGVVSITLSKPFDYTGENILVTTSGVGTKTLRSTFVKGVNKGWDEPIQSIHLESDFKIINPYVEYPYSEVEYQLPALLFTYNNQATGYLTLTPKGKVVNIENITVNGVAQSVTNNSVEISVPTKISNLENDENYISEASVNTKVEDSTSASKSYTDTHVTALHTSVNGLENTKADKTELETKADKTEIPQFVFAANEDAVPTDRDSRTVFLVGNEEKKIINFYIDEGTIHTFQAEEGMTWQEYVESDFKHEDIRINYDYNRVEHKEYPLKTHNYSIVNNEDVIISGHTYRNGYYWGGSN